MTGSTAFRSGASVIESFSGWLLGLSPTAQPSSGETIEMPCKRILVGPVWWLGEGPWNLNTPATRQATIKSTMAEGATRATSKRRSVGEAAGVGGGLAGLIRGFMCFFLLSSFSSLLSFD